MFLRVGIPRPIGNFLQSSSQAILAGISLVGRLGGRDSGGGVSFADDGTPPYEEFTRLVETRLAQVTFNYIQLAYFTMT